MLNGQKIIVVLPAYNAAKTLAKTYREIPMDLVDEVLLVDDASGDQTMAVATELGIRTIIHHETNKGYGGNQKTCYTKALEMGADIIIMLHPDYQYTPRLIPSMVHLISSGLYQVVLGSRILGRGALRGGMPHYKYIANRFLTLFQNLLINQKLSEYHTGYRAFSRQVLERINFQADSDDFVFDNQMIAQIFYAGFEIAEITCPTSYKEDGLQHQFFRSVTYGLGVVKTSLIYRMQKMKLARFEIFQMNTLTR
ncbi:MAG: glycosyltransferase family 2 protein [Bacteroidetes bacterium]|nr:glycosyltransferase family 2 protein [Bacteroidota bacterium]